MKHHTTRTAALLAALTLCAASAWAKAMPDAEFVELCEKGTAAQVKQALEGGANPNAEDEMGIPALMLAIANKNPGTAEALLAAGAKVNVMDGVDGGTPLIWAAAGDVGLVRALLVAGAQVNVQNDHGRSALMVAAQYGSPDVVAALLEAGADPSLKDDGENEAETPRDALWYAKESARQGWRKERVKDAKARRAEDDKVIKLLQGGSADAKEPVLVEVRHAEVKGKTRVTLKAKVPLTLLFRELEKDGIRKPSQVIKSSVRLAAGETHSFIHEQPFDLPTQAAVCAKPKSGAEMCWLHRDNEADEGGRFIMEPGFVLKN